MKHDEIFHLLAHSEVTHGIICSFISKIFKLDPESNNLLDQIIHIIEDEIKQIQTLVEKIKALKASMDNGAA